MAAQTDKQIYVTVKEAAKLAGKTRAHDMPMAQKRKHCQPVHDTPRRIVHSPKRDTELPKAQE